MPETFTAQDFEEFSPADFEEEKPQEEPPEEQVLRAPKEAPKFYEPGAGKALYERFRQSDVGRRLLGPTPLEKEAGIQSQGSPGEIVSTLSKFAFVPPPPIAEPMRENPVVGGVLSEPVLKHLPPKAAAILRGVRELGISSIAPAGAVPAGAGKAVVAGFGAEYLANLPEQVKAIKEAMERGDVTEALQRGTETVGGAALLGVGGAHSFATVRLPESLKAFEETTPTKESEVPSASEIRETTPVHGDVRTQPIEGVREMPAEVSGEGVQPQEKSTQPEIPLTEPLREEVTKNAQEEGKKEDAKGVLTPEQTAAEPTPPPVPQPTSFGPGGMQMNEPNYSAIQQLTDQLKTTPKVGTKESLTLKEKAADAWSAGKTLWDKTLGRLRATSETIKETARGVRNVTDLDRRLGEFDYALQKSAAQSREAGKVIERQMPNQPLRDATAIWIDAGGDEGIIREALAALPDKTSARVHRAVELASKLPPEGRQFAETLRQFYGIRQNDAVAGDIFEHGLADYFTHIWKKEENMPDSVRAAISNGRLNTYFQFSRQRKISTLLEGILQGKEPELDPAKVIPFYNYALDRTIASRKLIKEASDLTAKDGRPALAPTGIRNVAEKGTTDESLIIKPRAKPEAIGDYRSIEHPALRKWKWADTDESGKQTFYQSDLVVHPDFYERLARMMDRPRLTATKAGKIALRVGSEVKAFKLGMLSAFHQVHVGMHSAFHWTNPFKAGEINWEAPETQFAIEKGHLKLAPNPAELNVFAEGILSPGLVHKFPIIGPWSRAYSQWLFTDYIPRLKLATFQNAMKRNLKAYEGKIAKGDITPEEVASRVGDSMNNAYGELNHLFLNKYGRDPRFQRLLQGIFLAPDFGEARLRFAEKALTRYGHEERIALATMFMTLYTAARIGNWTSHGDPEWDFKRMFQVKVGDHWWSMRSVIGDINHALTNFGQFMRVRLSPLYSRTILELLTGRNERGQKVDAGDQLKDLAKQLVPIQLGGFTREDQKVWESFITAMGVSATRETVVQEMHSRAAEFLKQNNITPPAEIIPTVGAVQYRSLRTAISLGNDSKAMKVIEKLRETKSDKMIERAMKSQLSRPFTGSKEHERAWMDSMSPKEATLYEQAREQQQQEYQKFLELWDKRKGQ